ncbi:hypothetical protein FQN54_006306 [Arachnomyces sp. PD_36]|nr:hypothetical protein FQN54_006306 [Arachnomyces sp. PD_36]
MADVLHAPPTAKLMTAINPNYQHVDIPSHSTSAAGPSRTMSGFRNGHRNLDTFSPVNENGSFEFDRVLKSGKVFRRTKSKHAFTSSWRPAYLVLRPNLLSVYKDEEEAELRISITLSDVTAAAAIKPRRSTREHVFGIFSPSKNYRFQALSERDAEDWIDLIRTEARVEGDEDEAFFAKQENTGMETKKRQFTDTASERSDDNRRSCSPELFRSPSAARGSGRLSYIQDYSGNEISCYSDFSDAPAASSKPSTALTSVPTNGRPPTNRKASQTSEQGGSSSVDPERVLYNGYLHCLKSKGGVRQWKKLWVVLRWKSLTFYKDESEYSALRVIPMAQIINAAEIDPMSRSKTSCLQIIVEEKTYRFCAPDEESLAKWLGSLKSILIRRDEATRKLIESAPIVSVARPSTSTVR